MKTRTLGKSGFDVSEVGLGCWQLGGDFGPIDEPAALAILAAAAAAGISFWDTADVYGGGLSEQRIGRFLQDADVQPLVATKVGRDGQLYPSDYTKDRVRRNIEASARRLKRDAIDLVQLHCVPPEVLYAGDLLAWMEDFQQAGLVRHFGASVETLAEAAFVVTHPGLTSLQIIFNVFRQNAARDLFPAAIANDVGIVVRLPLASGVLSGKMTRNRKFDPTDHRQYNRSGDAFSQGETFSGIPFERAVDLVDSLRDWVPSSMTMAQMAMRWILDHEAVSTVIAGASRPGQVSENAAASDLPPLPAELHVQLGMFYRDRVENLIQVPV